MKKTVPTVRTSIRFSEKMYKKILKEQKAMQKENTGKLAITISNVVDKWLEAYLKIA